MRVRIEYVAEAAGVSRKTVSRVLNNEPNVREEMRARVMKAMDKLQYKPNPSARSLAAQRSYSVALVYNNPSRNYMMEVQNGMLEACLANHYNLFLAPVSVGRERVDQVLQRLQVEGGRIVVSDRGALDYAIEARVETAVRRGSA